MTRLTFLLTTAFSAATAIRCLLADFNALACGGLFGLSAVAVVMFVRVEGA